MNRRSLLAVLAWVAVAVLVTVISTWAISLLGAGLSQHVVSPMSPEQVKAALAGATPGGATPPRATPAPPSSGRPDTAASVKAFTTPGGSVVAACRGGEATLRSWSPAQGFGIDDVKQGPDAKASIEFESEDVQVTLEITCSKGVAVGTTKVERD
ncbi:hypothetical protein [Rhizohabitans arisaemae]|uniref:hypothetical protein n=1 Tax=Rhizohabitans arisaemae TaxID=2720610 RepID=UPI0024B05E0E|nr:hypothetical protein [Rhizohabitans arisaemae]